MESVRCCSRMGNTAILGTITGNLFQVTMSHVWPAWSHICPAAPAGSFAPELSGRSPQPVCARSPSARPTPVTFRFQRTSSWRRSASVSAEETRLHSAQKESVRTCCWSCWLWIQAKTSDDSELEGEKGCWVAATLSGRGRRVGPTGKCPTEDDLRGRSRLWPGDRENEGSRDGFSRLQKSSVGPG